MSAVDFAGAQNEPDDGGAGAPPVPSPVSIPSVSQGAPAAPVAPSPAAPVAPSGNDAAIHGLLARLDAMQHPQQAAPPSKLAQVLKFLVPLLAATTSAATGRGAEGWAQGTQRANDAQMAKQRAVSQQADQDAQAQERIAQSIHQLQIEDIATKRADAVAKQQARAEADRQAGIARADALATHKFVQDQTANPTVAGNWSKNALDILNAHPEQADKLSLEGPGKELIPVKKLIDWGYITKDPTSGQYGIRSARPPVEITTHDKDGSVERVMIDPDTNQVLKRTKVGEDKEKAPPTPHYSEPKDVWNAATGQYEPGKTTFNTASGKYELVGGVGPTGPRKPEPGAQQEAVWNSKRNDAIAKIAQVDKSIDAAKDLIGPGAGRVSTFQQMLGNPDPRISALKTKLLAIKDQAAGAMTMSNRQPSPTVLKRFDELLGTQLTPESLHAATAALKEMLQPEGGNHVTVGETYVKDASGKWVKQ